MIDPLDRPVLEHMARVLCALGLDTSLAPAGKLLADQHLSGAPVVDDQGKLLGVISRADLVEASASATVGVARYHVLHDGKTLTSSAILGAEGAAGVVAERMTRDVLTIGGDAQLRDAVRLMVTREVHRDKRALDAFRKALAVDPYLEKVPQIVKQLTEKVEGRDI